MWRLWHHPRCVVAGARRSSLSVDVWRTRRTGEHADSLQQCNLGKGSLVHWIMASPWFGSPRQTVGARMRYCVLKKFRSKCSVSHCGNTWCEAELKVASRSYQSKGGRLIFDNLLTLCENHFRESRERDYQTNRLKILSPRREARRLSMSR